MEVSGVTSGRRDRQRRPVQGCTARNGRTAPNADSSSRRRTWHGTGRRVVGERETDGGVFLGRGELMEERSGSESKEVRFRELFADDTTIVGTKEEMDGGVNAMKEVMGRFEERSNDQKEECLDFCMEESDSIRVLGSWVGMKEDVNMRLRRAGGLWAKVKSS